MNFLYPGFLLALTAIAIPVVIHLFNFRKFRKVYFTNVRLLKSVQQQNSSRRNLRNRLIMLMRILAIFFMVLAFAKPYLPTKSGEKNKNSVVSVYLDNSFSMETINRDGSLIDEARRRAKEIALSYNLNDKFQLLTSDFEGRHQRLLNRDEFIEALNDVKAGSNFKTIRQVIERQSDILSREPFLDKVSYIISDFQKNVIPGENMSVSDSTLDLRFVKLGSTAVANVSVDSVWFASPIHRVGSSERLIVKLRNTGSQTAESVPLKLMVNGVQKSIATVTIAPETTTTDTLDFSGLSGGWQNCVLSVKDYPVVFDDEFYFSFKVLNKLDILVIHPQRNNKFIDAVYRADPFFNAQNILFERINYSTLAQYPFIILDEPRTLSSGFIQQIKSYLQKGGSIFLFPSVDGQLNELSVFLGELGIDRPNEIVASKKSVSKINLRHQVFKDVFENVPANLNLPVAQKYIDYRSVGGSVREQILDFSDGATFIAEYKIGKGNIYLSAVPADDKASNLVRHSIFIPIMYQSALSGLKSQILYYTIGLNQVIETNRISKGPDQKLVLKNEGYETIPEVRQTDNATTLFFSDQVKSPGNFSLYQQDSLLAILSFNDDKSESDLRYADDKEITSSVEGIKVKLFNPKRSSLQKEIIATDSGLQLWKVCLVLSLIFLAAEILLLRLLKDKRLEAPTV